MTDKKYSGVGSRIVLKTLKHLSSLDDEDIFLSESIADRPELRVQLRYFTVELTPSRRLVKRNGGHCESPTVNSIANPRHGKKKTEAKATPSEATSCESFHSCRSTTSVQEVKGNSNEICSNQPSCVVRKTIRDDDLLNHLTMVNAIFLGDSVSEPTHCVPRTEDVETSVPCAASSSNKACTEAYTCQVNHNPKVRYISRVMGRDAKTPVVTNDFGYYDGKKSREKLSYSREFSDSFEPVSNIKGRNENLSSSMRNDFSIPSSRFEKNVLSTSSVSVFRKVEERVCKMKFAEVPLSEGNSISSTLEKSGTDWRHEANQRRRRMVIPGCEEDSEGSAPGRNVSVRLVCCSEESLKLTSPNASSSMVYVENADNNSDPVDVFQGDGDFSGFQNNEISSRVLKKQQLNNLDDNFLRMMIRKSIKKLHYESEESLTATGLDEYDIFQPNKERDIHEEECASLTEVDSTKRSVFIEERESSKSLDVSGRDKLKVNEGDNQNENLSLTPIDEIDSDYQKQGIDAKRSESSKYDDTFGNGFCKRAFCDRTRTTGLPVIQEESAEEVLNERQDLREDNLDDDYCLIDSSGTPIHLFDTKGLPLTDNNGRPLRSAKGKLLLSCDQNGIPVVDSDSPIFDMMGRQPHEDGFDPAAAPQAAGGRLTAGDGRPLLLFDAAGRPLTTRSGTMLLDARGHGLVQLTPT